MRTIAVLAAIAATLIATAAANAGNYGYPRGSETAARNRAIICDVFGSHCRDAIAVARCESGYNPEAYNGQYLGVMQMGSWERRTYGHAYGSSAAVVRRQAEAAYRYFRASGSNWGPWECKPW